MMIVLTQKDLAKLSPQLRRELQQFLFDGSTHEEMPEFFRDEAFDGIDVQEPYDDISIPWESAQDLTGDAKVVVDISDDQAKALVANLSSKSIDTLRLFATGEVVSLESLVGAERPYASFADLKRSFVGAVNRRLRTVTRNRSAVLFRKVDGVNGVGIAVRPKTASALQVQFKYG